MHYGENVFRLENPDEWFCQLSGYAPSHSLLWFLTSNEHTKQHFFICFRHVKYYRGGPNGWKGANFSAFELDDDDARQDFLTLSPLPLAVLEFKESYRLFHLKFQAKFEDHPEMIIVANAGWLSDKPAYEGTNLLSIPPLSRGY